MIQVEPLRQPLNLRGRQVELVAMHDQARASWWELQVRCATERVQAASAAQRGELEEFGASLVALLKADYLLTQRALGWNAEEVEGLTLEERQAVINAQDKLNGYDQLQPLFEQFGIQSALKFGK